MAQAHGSRNVQAGKLGGGRGAAEIRGRESPPGCRERNVLPTAPPPESSGIQLSLRWIYQSNNPIMKKTSLLSLALSLSLFTGLASAGTVKIPDKKPVVSVNVPDSWKPEELEKGFSCESPDQVVTIIFEVTSAKGVDKLIEENIDWLTKEQEVEIDEKTQSTKDFEANGIEWKRISWDGKSEDWGPSLVGLMFTDAGKGKILTVTYWVVKKDFAKQEKALEKILSSVKRIE
jgi:hypothetical protein